MDTEFWLDGFNFFHHWEKSRGLFGPDGGMDIARALARALRILSNELDRKRGMSLVFLDGGLSRSETRQAGLRVRYCGPGNKADDRMAEDLAGLGSDARSVIAVSNDRELKSRLMYHGAACMGVNEFLSLLRKKNGGAARLDGEAAGIMREKCRRPSPAEVGAWLELFGGDIEG